MMKITVNILCLVLCICMFSALLGQNSADISTKTNAVDLQEAAIYPNPISSTFKLKNSKDVEIIAVYNLAGVKMAEFSKSTSNSYSLSHLSKGIYIIRLFRSKDDMIKMIRVLKK